MQPIGGSFLLMKSKELTEKLLQEAELDVVQEPLLDFTIQLEREEDLYVSDEDGNFQYVRFTRTCSVKVTITEDEIILDPDIQDTCYTVNSK